MMSPRIVFLGALAGSLALLAVRFYAANTLGYGDAEALYACYARHPQAVYLDHPGLVGVLARALGGGDILTPATAHRATALAATAAPWLVASVARQAGASWKGACLAALPILLSPVTSVGLFAMTPDLLLFYTWYAAVGFAVRALQSAPGSTAALVNTLGASFFAGLACDAKVSGILLVAGLVFAFASREARPHLRTSAPYAGLIVTTLLVWPVLTEEVTRDYPMLRHRFFDLHTVSGPSLRNALAFLGGQLLYVSPAMAVAACFVGRELHRMRKHDIVSRLLFCVTAASLPLVLLCLCSRVAEPHWAIPVYLALPVHFARFHDDVVTRGMGRRLALAAGVVAFSFTVLAHTWVLLGVGTLLGTSVARTDLVNDLLAWRAAMPTVRQALRESETRQDAVPVVVGSHWIICAQLHAALPRSVLVGCNSPEGDDFRDWLPPSTWRNAEVLLYVTDSRMTDLNLNTPKERSLDAIWTAPLLRSGMEVRTITVQRLLKTAIAGVPSFFGAVNGKELTLPPTPRSPDR